MNVANICLHLSLYLQDDDVLCNSCNQDLLSLAMLPALLSYYETQFNALWGLRQTQFGVNFVFNERRPVF